MQLGIPSLHAFSPAARKQLWLYWLYQFTSNLHLFGAVLIPFFTITKGLTLFEVQLLQGWFMGCWMVLEVPTGAVADYLGRKYSLALGSFTLVFAVAVYFFGTTMLAFMFAELLFGAAKALVSGANEAWLYDTLQDEGQEKSAVKHMGFAQSVLLLGVLVAGPIGSVLAGATSLAAPVLASGGFFLIASIVAMKLKEPKRHSAQKETLRFWQLFISGARLLKHDAYIRELAIENAIVAASAYFVIWFYQPLLMEQNVAVFWFGWFWSGVLLLEMLVSANFERLEKFSLRFGSYRLLSLLLVALGYAAAVFWQSLWGIVIMSILVGGFGLTRMTYAQTLIHHRLDSSNRATVISTIAMLRQLLLLVLNPLVGYMASQSLRGALVFVGLLPLAYFAYSKIAVNQRREHVTK